MKKLICIFSISITLISFSKSMAQNGRNNNSDFKVPLPVVAPSLNPDFGYNIAVPAMPPIIVPPGVPTIMAASYLPQLPSSPAMPMAPESNMVQSIEGDITQSNFPKTIMLPPLPPIPSNPQVRLALY
jgi:hypothetical protein